MEYSECRELCVKANNARQEFGNELLMKWQAFIADMQCEFKLILDEYQNNHGLKEKDRRTCYYAAAPVWIKSGFDFKYDVCVFDDNNFPIISNHSSDKCYGYVYSDADAILYSCGSIELDEFFFEPDNINKLKAQLLAEFNIKVIKYLENQITESNIKQQQIKKLEDELEKLKSEL